MTGAPIMGSRTQKLKQAAQLGAKLVRQCRMAECKRVCGDGGKIKVRERKHTVLCQRMSKQMAQQEALFRGL